MEGSNADCAEPLCCRLTNGPAASKEQAAGKYVVKSVLHFSNILANISDIDLVTRNYNN